MQKVRTVKLHLSLHLARSTAISKVHNLDKCKMFCLYQEVLMCESLQRYYAHFAYKIPFNIAKSLASKVKIFFETFKFISQLKKLYETDISQVLA